MTTLSRWVRITPDGMAEVCVGKAELGQGILTALGQLAADELAVDMARIRMLAAHTDHGPDAGLTAGSLSVSTTGPALRRVCANVRARFVAEAARQWGVDAAALVVTDGRIETVDGSRRTSYGELAGSVDLNVEVDPEVPLRGVQRVVGTSVPRLDLPDKIAGRARFLSDLRLPGMLHGRVVRPPAPGAQLLSTVDIEGLVRDGSFLGVIGEDEPAVERAAERLRAGSTWTEPAELPDENNLIEFLRRGPHETIPLVNEPFPDERTIRPAQGPPDFQRTGEHRQSMASEHSPGERTIRPARGAPDFHATGEDRQFLAARLPGTDPEAAAQRPLGTDPEVATQRPLGTDPEVATRLPGTDPEVAAGRQVSARYSRPYLAHASIAPSCGVARWEDDGRLSVWSHSQGIHRLRDAIAQALGLEPAAVAVQHVEHAGSYGHNGADDAAFDAVLLARAAPGRPVRVCWSRRDELTWSPLGSAMVAEVSATVDHSGRIRSWAYDVWSQGHTARPGHGGAPGLLGSQQLKAAADPPLPAGGTTRNAIPAYDVGARRITGHRLLESPIRTSSLRSLGAFMNVFAIESFMDELAGDRDPLEFRLAHLSDARARKVLKLAAAVAGWGSTQDLGIGFAQYKGNGAYCAVVAEVEAEHDIRVRRLTIAADVGLAVNPDGVRNQLEGGAIQATSWTVKERVRFGTDQIHSDDWESYPILRFSEVPEVRVELVGSTAPSVGAGEAAQGPTAGAIANAVAAAVGLRVRDLPITRDAVIAAIG